MPKERSACHLITAVALTPTLRTPPIRPNTHTQTHTEQLSRLREDRISVFAFLSVSLGRG